MTDETMPEVIYVDLDWIEQYEHTRKETGESKYISEEKHKKILISYCKEREHHPDCDMLEAAGFGSMANKCTCNSCYEAKHKQSITRLIERVEGILKGIDETQTDSKDGWWETSTGADFGKQKLDNVLAAIEKELL
jgi:hypothetical protein